MPRKVSPVAVCLVCVRRLRFRVFPGVPRPLRFCLSPVHADGLQCPGFSVRVACHPCSLSRAPRWCLQFEAGRLSMINLSGGMFRPCPSRLAFRAAVGYFLCPKIFLCNNFLRTKLAEMGNYAVTSRNDRICFFSKHDEPQPLHYRGKAQSPRTEARQGLARLLLTRPEPVIKMKGIRYECLNPTRTQTPLAFNGENRPSDPFFQPVTTLPDHILTAA